MFHILNMKSLVIFNQASILHLIELFTRCTSNIIQWNIPNIYITAGVSIDCQLWPTKGKYCISYCEGSFIKVRLLLFWIVKIFMISLFEIYDPENQIKTQVWLKRELETPVLDSQCPDIAASESSENLRIFSTLKLTVITSIRLTALSFSKTQIVKLQS